MCVCVCVVEEIVLIDIWVMERMRSVTERGISDEEEERGTFPPPVL